LAYAATGSAGDWSSTALASADDADQPKFFKTASGVSVEQLTECRKRNETDIFMTAQALTEDLGCSERMRVRSAGTVTSGARPQRC